MGHRRKAREYALQGLYMHEVGKKPIEEIITLEWVDKTIPDDIRDFAITLIRGSISHLDEIDAIIKNHSKNWKIERLTVVDKSILRISIYAMNYMPEIPLVVTINEAIELGKIYGGENSGQFINGILDAIKNADHPREEAQQ
ncbi:MAG TPA: transcription antitermination factor NusB [Spirochaetota bacterium]|nr:transcription antitermination factor NusB [Spirochaetota bacterium]HPI89661.1 transcription antitermination factor NusB [Spirochaetota bacterium]HPR49753.1 transcription antitermination factor NusB [Spirochaetota bacterium]